MYKMARSPRLHLARWVLWALAVCLALHFLVEDSALLSVWEAGAQPGMPEQTGIPGSDEMAHQDDLAIQVNLPEQTANPIAVTAPLDRFSRAQPAFLPIRIPPKVA